MLSVAVAALIFTVACEHSDAPSDRLSPEGVQKELCSRDCGSDALQDGDLIFQESVSGQSDMVRALTRSRWTHMGVVFKSPTGTMVFEASSSVIKTPLADWIARGRQQIYVVKRFRDSEPQLPAESAEKLRRLGESWMGRPYDRRFRWDDQAMYCSEFAFKMFERALGVRLGKLERAADMDLHDESVKQALRERFKDGTFDPNETVVTPDAIFKDQRLVVVEQG